MSTSESLTAATPVATPPAAATPAAVPATTTATTGGVAAPVTKSGSTRTSPTAGSAAFIGNLWGSVQKGLESVQKGIEKSQEQARMAKQSKAEGKIFDKEKKEWYFYYLDDEWEQLLVEEKTMNLASDGSSVVGDTADERKVADREYYDLLHVSTNATAADIKKAYYKQARKCHPDKNPGDEAAHAQFQALGHAYNILSNEQLRANYDKHGKKSDSENAYAMSEIDPMVFFNCMFGSTLVEPYIGELWIAATADAMMKDDDGLNPEELEQLDEDARNAVIQAKMEKVQKEAEFKRSKRVVQCAKNLRDRIKAYELINFDRKEPEKQEEAKKASDAFQLSCREEALKIVQGAQGDVYCQTIGFAYNMHAQEYLSQHGAAQWWAGQLAKTRQGLSGIGSNFALIGAGIRAASAGSRAMHTAEKLQRMQQQQQLEEEQGTAAATEATAEKTTDEATKAAGEKRPALDEQAFAAQMEENINESLPAFLNLAWAINKKDIQQTLKDACQKLFDDASVPMITRIQRAKAVHILGREFQQVGMAAMKLRKQELSAEDIKAQLSVAAMTTMAKAQGQEFTQDDQEELMKQAKQKGTPSVSSQTEQEEETDETESTPIAAAPTKAAATTTKLAASGEELD